MYMSQILRECSVRCSNIHCCNAQSIRILLPPTQDTPRIWDMYVYKIYVYMYICIYVICTYVCMYICIYVYMYTFILTCIYVCVCVCIYIS